MGGRNGFKEACWSQDTLDLCLPGGPEARCAFQVQGGRLQKGLHLDLGLARSAGVLDFLLKAMGTHRRVSKQKSYLVILDSFQKTVRSNQRQRPVKMLV